ncbi:TPA: hypothetical protein QCO21_001544 [Bacillus cereus]|nr:hypothetical protein [Bacillus cereus]
MSGFIIAILSIAFAVKGSDYWIVLVVLATVLAFLSVNRPDKIYKSRG